MKVALCISGLPRTWKKTFPEVQKNLIQYHNADVFIHSWFEENEKEFDELLEAYKPKRFLLEKNNSIHISKEYDGGVPGHTVYAAFSMYKSIWSCNSIKSYYESENNFTYDWVFRIRFDYLINSHIDISKYDNNFLYVPNRHSSHPWNNKKPTLICDMFAFSSSSTMNSYSAVYQNIDRFYEEGLAYKNLGYDIKHVVINGEHLLCRQLMEANLTDKIKYINHFPFIR